MTSEYYSRLHRSPGRFEAAMDAMAGTLSANQEVVVLYNLTKP